MVFSICFSLKLNGDPFEKITTRLTEFMLTTGKILEENLLILNIVRASEKTGDQQDI
jgi:hypothetical protein